MKDKTEEGIKKSIEGINEDDLSRRLKDFYKKREYIKEELEKQNLNSKRKESFEKMQEEVELYIKVYEKELPIRSVERAKRSAGLYKNPNDLANSIKRENDDVKAYERQKNREK